MDFTKYTLIPFLFAKKDLLFDFIKKKLLKKDFIFFGFKERLS